jgi:hypothetical protein
MFSLAMAYGDPHSSNFQQIKEVLFYFIFIGEAN